MTPPADIIIVVLGAPASGKGTLCARAAADPSLPHRIQHVSAGDLLRAVISGQEINGYIARGTVLPGDAVVPILRDHIAGLPSAGGEKVVLLDGFPRNVEQEEAARTVLASERGKGKFPDLAVYFSCPKDVLKERFVSHKRGQDDGALFEKRFEQHEKEFPDVMGIYKSRSVLVEIDSTGGIDETYEAFVDVLKTFWLSNGGKPKQVQSS